VLNRPVMNRPQDEPTVLNRPVMNRPVLNHFTRNVDKSERIGRLVEGRSRPLRVMLKQLEGKKEILARAKLLKEAEKFKKMFISPDLTRKKATREGQRIEKTIEVNSCNRSTGTSY
jgi:hypothetical protein